MPTPLATASEMATCENLERLQPVVSSLEQIVRLNSAKVLADAAEGDAEQV